MAPGTFVVEVRKLSKHSSELGGDAERDMASGSNTALNVGTIRGRHPLPVDRFLIESEVEPGQEAYDTAYRGAVAVAGQVGPGAWLNLFYTGLTEATIGALDGFAHSGTNVRLMRYDAQSGDYQPLVRRIH